MKTTQNDRNVDAFINSITDIKKRRDCFTIMELMKKATGQDPKMWDDSIVGFGSYHYKYESGREGDWFIIGFSPRKQNITLYTVHGFVQYNKLLEALGKYKAGKSCLYINRLEDVNMSTLDNLIKKSVEDAFSSPTINHC